MTAARVTRVRTHAFRVPTDGPGGTESDGTLDWDATTAVLVEVSAGGQTGIGYTYGDASVASFVDSALAEVVIGSDPAAPAEVWVRMFAAIRNAGRPGVGAMAVAAVDIALWDLHAKLRDLPLVAVLPAFRTEVPIYGSGGFTNYPTARLVEQLAGWVADGIPRVKLKTSRHPDEDPGRIAAVRAAIGAEPDLLADANGALTRKQARYWAERLASEWGVCWFEEPVSSADFDGLRLLREHGPSGMDIAAGEYGFVTRDFQNLLAAGAVDCLQADVTRCGGITGLLEVGALAAGWQLDVSAHCAPAVSAHAFCAVRTLRHLEYFHDHVRVEHLLFDGVVEPDRGVLRPAPDRPGLGLRVRWPDAQRYRL